MRNIITLITALLTSIARTSHSHDVWSNGFSIWIAGPDAKMSELRAAKVVSDFSRATREKEGQGTLRRETVSVNFHTDSACNVAPTKVDDYFRAPMLGACSLCEMRLSTYRL